MKTAVLAFFALLAASPVVAHAQVRDVKIVSFGIYTADAQSSTRDSQGVKQNISTNFRLAVATTTVPIQLGVRFGFEYIVAGPSRGAAVSLKKVTVYPEAGLKSPAVPQPIYQNESVVSAKVGEKSYTGYRLDDPWELVPGDWLIQLWDGDRKPAEKKFTLVAR